MTLGGVQLELELADRAAARDRQRLNRPQRQRPWALDQVLLVKRAQLALGLPRRGAHPLRGALGATERHPREGEAPEQVVPVGVGPKQAAGSWVPGLFEQRPQRFELLRQDGGVDDEGLVPRLWA